MEPVLRENPNFFEPWMTVVFLVTLISIAYVRMVYGKRFNLLVKMTLRLQILRQVMREELLFSHRASLFLFGNFVLSAALMIYIAFQYLGWDIPGGAGFMSYLIIALSVLLLYLMKFALIGFIKWLFQDKGVLREYRFEVFSVAKVIGLILLPLSLVTATTNLGNTQTYLLIGAGIFCLAFLFRTIQGLVLSFSQSVSAIYIILYLCTLEILPVLLFMGFFLKEFVRV